MNTPALSLNRIGQIAINAKDVAACAAFYRDVLGLKHLFDAGPNLAFFDCGGVRLMITQPSAPKYDHPSSIGQLDQALTEAKAKGWTVVDMKRDWNRVFK